VTVGSMLPVYVTLPTGLIVMVLLAGHLTALARVEGMDQTRQRIRQANGVVMMILAALLVTGLSVIDPRRDPSAWILTWTVCIFLVLVMIAMATLDALNTVRIARERREELREWLLGRSSGTSDE